MTTERDYNFRHTDIDGFWVGRDLAMKLLRLAEPPPRAGLFFDLTHCTEPGAMDRFQITLPVSEGVASAIVAGLGARSTEEFVDDPYLGLDFLSLVDGEEEPVTVKEAAARFVSSERNEFQPECRATDPLWFGIDPGVNHWTALWYRDGLLSYQHFDQG